MFLIAFELFHVKRVLFKMSQLLFYSGINRKHPSENPLSCMPRGYFPRCLLVWCTVVFTRSYPCLGQQIALLILYYLSFKHFKEVSYETVLRSASLHTYVQLSDIMQSSADLINHRHEKLLVETAASGCLPTNLV